MKKRLLSVLLLSTLVVTCLAMNPDHAGDVVPLQKGIFDNRMADVQSRSGDQALWSHVIEVPGAKFVKLYFENYHLMAGDMLEIRDASGIVRQRIMSSGPAGAAEFWSLTIPGETVILQITSATDYIKRYAFSITKAFKGTMAFFALPEPTESDCGGLPQASPYRSAWCYSPGEQFENAAMWQNAQATVGVLTIGSYGGGTWCSGSLVSSQNYVITNQHCIETISDCANTEFVFNYYRTTCEENIGGEDPVVTQGYYCDSTDSNTYFNNSFGSCTSTGLDDLDYAFCHVLLNGPDPAPSTVYTPLEMELDHQAIVDTEDIYIVGHPQGNARVISEGILDFTGDYSLHYICDTRGGSSGSPVYSRATNRMIGLHHCGGCTSSSDRNRGMFITQIRADIDSHGNFFAPAPQLVFESITHSDQVGGNDDGYFDPGETIHVTAVISNAGNLASTEGSLVVSSTSPSVSIPVSSFTISALDPHVEANSTTVEFEYSLDSFMECGAAFDINLALSYDGKVASANSEFHTGHLANPGSPIDETAADLPLPITDNNTTVSYITVDTGTDVVGTVNEVQVDITHTYIGDLTVTLTSPGGVAATLHNRTGGTTDDLHVIYGDGTGGTTTPVQSLDMLTGQVASGTWSLTVNDGAGGDTGELTNWRLNFTPVELQCGSTLPAFTIGSVQAVYGDSITVSLTMEQDLANFGFDVLYDPGKIKYTGFSPGASAGCTNATVTLESPGVIHVVANCPSQIMAGQLFGDLNFDVTGLTGETPISAANLVLDLQSKIYGQGILSLPETVDLCTVPEAYYYNMLWSPYFNDPDVDVDKDGVFTILDFISRMNCPL